MSFLHDHRNTDLLRWPTIYGEMSSDFLYSSYMRYKADTDAVATWLLNTAMGRGYTVAHNLDRAETAVKVPRLKGKARTLARASHPATRGHESPITAAYRITISDFFNLAKFISKANKPRVKVPSHFVLQLRQAIKTRKSHQAWYESRCTGTADSLASDCGHAFFIRTLESVVEILRPIMPEAPPPVREDASTGSSPLANMFEHLVVEETLETNSHSKVEPRLGTPARISATIESTKSGRKQEAFVASTLLSHDVHQLRGVVQTVWKDYHEGKASLVAASITTNTAIDFCRKLQEDFEKSFPGQDRCHERVCLHCSVMEDGSMRESDLLPCDGPCLEAVHRIIERFMDDIKDDAPDDLPTVSAECIQPYLKSPQASGESGKGEGDSDTHHSILMGVLPELCALIRATTPLSDHVHAEHEIMRAMRHLLSCKTQTLWVTFAFQVLLDIRQIMRGDVAWAFDDLCQGSEMIASNIEKVLDFNVEAGVTDFSHAQDKILSNIVGLVRQWTETDVVSILINRNGRFGDTSVARNHIPPYYLLERDPIWCGTLLYSFRMMAHEAAITMATSWHRILATAHLYNSLRQSDLLTCQWEDMERVISMHGPENLFVGAAPTTFGDCLKRFSIAAGMRASEFAPNHHRKEASNSYLKRRHLKQLTPVSSLFAGRYCHADGRTDLGPNDVIKVLRQKASEESAEIYQMSSGDDICDIIEKLRLAIEHETTQMTFNHFEMHILCSKILRQLHVTLGAHISNWSERYRDYRNLFEIVLALLLDATKGSSVIFEAGELMATFVARNGDVAQRDMRAVCEAADSRKTDVSDSVVSHDDASDLLIS